MSKEMKGKMDPGAIAGSDVGKGFIIDAWLANQDVVGAGGDNVLIEDGKSHRVDNGSSFMFRARGDLKPFGAAVPELDTMRDPKYPAGRMAFSTLTDAELVRQIREFKVNYEANKAQIDKMIDAAGLTPTIHDQIKASLAARAQWITTVGLHALEKRAGLPDSSTSETPTRKNIIPFRTGATQGPSVDEVAPSARVAAREHYAEVLSHLEKGEDLPVKTGEVSVEMMQGITLATGREVALIRRVGGGRFLRLGEAHSVALPEDPKTVKIIAHTHPGGQVVLSGEDVDALVEHDQLTTVVITPTDAGRLAGKGYDAARTPQNQLSEEVPLATLTDLSGDMSRLDEIQLAVVKDTFEQAATRSAAAHAQLLAKIATRGYTEDDLKICLAFIKDKVPVQVQF